jgi:Glycosyl hydrolase family 63 C-terminal domain
MISVYNRGQKPAELHVLPTLWFRNQWSWHGETDRPSLQQVAGSAGLSTVKATDAHLGERYLYCEGEAGLLFTENETNTQRIFGVPNRTPYVKDGIDNFVVNGQAGAVNPEKKGTKVAADYRLTVNPGQCQVIRLRLSDTAPSSFTRSNGKPAGPFGPSYEEAFQARRREADEFYATVIPANLDADHANVMRQALAGMLWSKQFYHYDVDKWLEERGSDPFKQDRKSAPRNDQWHHMYNGDVISMPDKWEYPWYAAWDLAFHVIALTLVDPDFGKQQLKLMLRERYMHPNGQIPAYEWNFGDVNPPVHAWSTIFTYGLEKMQKGEGDRDWLKSSFQKLLLNFTWWVNRKDRSGRNVFEGGFLGLDNIGVFDRSAPLPTGGYLEQADGTAWMALFCQNMLQIAAELAQTDADYADMCLKFVEHFLWIASSMTHLGGETGMWDEEDGFFYDVLRLPNGQSQRLKVRSMVGLLPLCAASVFEYGLMAKYPELAERFRSFITARPEILAAIHNPAKEGCAGRKLAAILDETKLRRVLAKMLDENEFLSPFGIRSLSRYHADHPYVFNTGGQEYRVSYLPAESDTGMFGGNSNWRGPIWMPVNGLIIRALMNYYAYYGDEFTVECPTGSGRHMTLYQVAEEISNRLARIFLKDKDGRRPVYGGTEKFQKDPHWRDCLQFYEYFHGDNGAGLGASHQTGWTGVVARGMHMFATTTAEQVLRLGRLAAVVEVQKETSGPAVDKPAATQPSARGPRTK